MSAIIGFINLNGENVNEAIGNDMVEKLNIYKLDSIKTMKKIMYSWLVAWSM